MKPWKVTLGLLVLVLTLAMSAIGFASLGWLIGLMFEAPVAPVGWSVSVVDLGLVGVILVLLAALTGVLARGPYSKRAMEREALEARMVQDLYRGFASMDERLEALESAAMRRVGRLKLGPKTN